jgi:CheY-like chemotaxis protein
MVNDLLDMAKVEAGKIDFRPGTVEVARVFGALRGMMRPLIQNEQVNLNFEDPPADLILHTDEGKVNQILRNLISNAIKFTEQGEVFIRAWTEEDSVFFAVTDTGIGIAANHQESIFREFSQVENPLQARVRGTGLGLPLSRRLAELLGGTLTCTSKEGVGSTFVLQLPLLGAHRPGEPVSTETAMSSSLYSIPAYEGTHRGTILVVDDEVVARYLAKQLFRGSQYLITEAANGVEGFERARFDRPDLILLDLAMPHRSGFDLLDDLKSDPATKDIPVVLNTSATLTAADLERLDGQYVAILSKQPGDRSQAYGVIRNILGEPELFAK